MFTIDAQEILRLISDETRLYKASEAAKIYALAFESTSDRRALAEYIAAKMAPCQP